MDDLERRNLNDILDLYAVDYDEHRGRYCAKKFFQNDTSKLKKQSFILESAVL